MNERHTHSRPKIHRLPQRPVKPGELYLSRTVLIVGLALLVVAGAPALWSLREEKPSSAGLSEQPPVALQSFESVSVQDRQGQVIGRLVKMPADTEKAATIGAVSRPDPAAGRELMNIISQQ